MVKRIGKVIILCCLVCLGSVVVDLAWQSAAARESTGYRILPAVFEQGRPVAINNAYARTVIYSQSWQATDTDLFRIISYRCSGEEVQDPRAADACVGPNSIAIGPDGVIYVSDPAAGRIQKLDPSGRRLGFLGAGVAANYSDLGVDLRGCVYALNRYPSPHILKLDAAGAIAAVYRPALGLVLAMQVYPSGRVDVSDFVSGEGLWRVTHLDLEGNVVGVEAEAAFDQEQFMYEDWNGNQYRCSHRL
jgi:hypothetical protein